MFSFSVISLKIKAWYNNLPLDQKITNQVMLILAVISLVTGFYKSFFSFAWWYPLNYFIGGILGIILLLINYFSPGNKSTKIVFVVSIYIIAIVTWINNGGMNGPTTLFIFTIYIFTLGIYNRYFFLTFVVNIVIVSHLVIYSYLEPSFVKFSYKNPGDQVIDLLYSYILLGITVIFILKSLIVNYQDANQKAKMREQQLKTLNQEFKLKNDALEKANKDLSNAKKNLEENEEKLRRILESSDDFIWTVDPVNFGLQTFNSTFAIYFLVRENMLVKTGDTPEILSPQRCDEWRMLYQKALETGRYETEYAMPGTGQVLDLAIHTLIQNDEIFGISVFGKDITQKREHENELREAKNQAEESEKQFRQLFENMELGFALHEMIYDSNNEPVDYRFVLLNRAFEKLTGASAENYIGRTIKELAPDTDMAQIQNYGKVAKTGQTLNATSFSKEQRKYFEITAYSPKRDFFAVLLNDVTKRKLFERELIKSKEKAEESDKLKTSFLHNISHEVRTPLNAITGFSALVTKPNLSFEKLQTYSKMIDESSEKLINIITDVIEISQIHANQLKVSTQETEILSLISRTVEGYSQKANKKGLSFDLQIMLNNNELVILTDVEKTIRLLSHLLDNAIKFTTQGGIKVLCTATEKSLQVSISDTGIGIPANLQKTVFEPFRQVETHVTKSPGGNGLGLAIVSAYCKELNYQISLESDIGKGSTFTLNIPLVNSN